ncbi:MAG: hypothetical protein MR611_07315 [Coriobacteriaceae bacterium]|nr:hypothetical protein [Coriobacteriaceae bacterium]
MSESTKRVIIGEAIAEVAWFIIMLTAIGIFTNPIVFVVSIMFGVLAFVASAVSVLVNDRDARSSGAPVEVRSLPVVVSLGYFAAALIANTIFCVGSPAMTSTTAPIVVNVVLLALMAVIRMGVDSHQRVAERNVEKVSASIAGTSAIGQEISRLLARAENPEVKAELRKLKEEFDYSPSVSGPSAQVVEQEFLSALAAVDASLARGDAPETALALVRKAGGVWKKRNAAMSA